MASVREYAILYIRGTRTGGTVVGGGNAVLATGVHALDGPEHTGQLPIERLSTDETATAKVLHPNGTGGVSWSDTLSGDFLTSRGGEGHIVYTNSVVGATQALDLASYNTFDLTLTEACTLSFAGSLDSGIHLQWTIILRGEFTVTWPGTVQWRDTDGSGTTTPPTMSGEENVVVLTTLDGGASYGAAIDNGGGSSGGVSALDDLSDAQTTGETAGAGLFFDGSVWRPAYAPAPLLLEDGTIAILEDGSAAMSEPDYI